MFLTNRTRIKQTTNRLNLLIIHFEVAKQQDPVHMEK